MSGYGVILSLAVSFSIPEPVFAIGLPWRRGRAKEKNQTVLASTTRSVSAIRATLVIPKLLSTPFTFTRGEGEGDGVRL